MQLQHVPVIHRDIKPANIKITPEIKAVLVDFGIAKLFYPDMSTATGARAVSFRFSHPEQHGVGYTDEQSDAYSLGATTYALLTGKEPPADMDVIAGLTPPPQPVKDINPAVSPDLSNAMDADRSC